MPMKKITPLLALICVFAACTPKPFEYKGIRNFSVKNWGFSESTVGFELQYFNPNNFSVTVKKVDADVFMNNQFVGKYHLDTTILVAKKADFNLVSSMQVDMRNLLKNSVTVLLNKEVTLKVVGKTTVKTLGITANVPVNYETVQKFSLFGN